MLESYCIFGDTPCAGVIRPAFGRDGTLYLSLASGAITAIDKAGQVVPGWPVQLGNEAHALGLQVDSNNRLLAQVTICDDFCGSGVQQDRTQVFAADGTLLKTFDR
jgi:hypothetical protein